MTYPSSVSIHVAEPWFSAIRDGYKTVEGRLNRGKFAELKEGTLIRFVNKDLPDQEVTTEVTRINNYASFADLLAQQGLARTLPGTSTLEQGVAAYRAFYNDAQEKGSGVLAIHVRVVAEK